MQDQGAAKPRIQRFSPRTVRSELGSRPEVAEMCPPSRSGARPSLELCDFHEMGLAGAALARDLARGQAILPRGSCPDGRFQPRAHGNPCFGGLARLSLGRGQAQFSLPGRHLHGIWLAARPFSVGQLVAIWRFQPRAHGNPCFGGPVSRDLAASELEIGLGRGPDP